MSRTIRHTLVASALAVALSAPALAAPDASPIELDRVRVTGQREGYAAQATRTATKTDTPLRDVPQAVSVVTREVIDDQGMTSLTDALRLVPGVGVAQGEGNRDTPVLRGSSTTGDLFIDGVRDDVQYIRDLYNVERVEVLKGPNAMVFGRGGAGGIVNRVMKAADGASHGELGVQLGSYGRRRGTVDLGGATGATSSVRVTGLYEDSDSYRDDFSLRRYGINPTLTWDPSDSTRLTFSYERFHDARVADRGVPSLRAFGIDRPVDVASDAFFGDPDRSPVRVTADIGSVRLEHAIGPGVTLRNHTRWARYDKFYQNVFANGTVPRAGGGIDAIISAYNNATLRTNLFNQTDVELKFDTGAWAHTLLAGAEVGRQETDNLRMTGVFPANRCASTRNVTNQTCVALDDGRYTGPLAFAPSATDADNHGVAKVAALYVQDQIELSPRWQALLGLRHDRFEVDLRNNRDGVLTSSRDDRWSPRAGLVWKPVEPLSVYGSYSLAYVPRAGDQLSSLSASNAALDPEKFVNREVGAKWQARPGLMLSAAVYRLDRGNVIAPDPDDSTRSILVDGQRTQGLELELAGRINSRWSVMAGYAYQDGEITRALSATTPAGTRLAQLPRHTASLWNRFDLSRRWGLGLGATYRGETYAALPGSAPGRADASRTVLDGFVRVDAAVYVRVAPQMRVQLNVENLFDRGYFVSANSNDNVTPGSPRAAYLGITYDF
jgi:catecholate siderophore receptor